MIDFQKIATGASVKVVKVVKVFDPVIYDTEKTSFPARENIGPKNLNNLDNLDTPKPFPAGWENRFTIEQLEALARRTVDGTMTDAEALRAEGLE